MEGANGWLKAECGMRNGAGLDIGRPVLSGEDPFLMVGAQFGRRGSATGNLNAQHRMKEHGAAVGGSKMEDGRWKMAGTPIVDR